MSDRTLSKLDKTIISLISRDIPLVSEPFKNLAGRIGMSERALLKRVRSFKKDGFMRKFSASINHRKIGFLYNAMVVWDIPEALIDKAGGIMASFSEVSHCYQREKRPDWNYNLYSMVHGRTKDECIGVVRKISDRIGLKLDRSILFSSKEYKKTGARY